MKIWTYQELKQLSSKEREDKLEEIVNNLDALRTTIEKQHWVAAVSSVCCILGLFTIPSLAAAMVSTGSSCTQTEKFHQQLNEICTYLNENNTHSFFATAQKLAENLSLQKKPCYSEKLQQCIKWHEENMHYQVSAFIGDPIDYVKSQWNASSSIKQKEKQSIYSLWSITKSLIDSKFTQSTSPGNQ